ncbi:hypothetical protein OQA88_1354 [Cercophora sp. LCS_1]
MEKLAAYVPIVHGVTALFTVIELGLVAYIVSPGWTYGTPPFMMFNTIWTLLVLAYIALAPRYFNQFFIFLAALALEAVTTIFWFAGSIALAANWASPRCGSSYCHTINAAVAFGFFIWALFTYLLVVDVMEFLRTRRQPTTAPAAKPYATATV